MSCRTRDLVAYVGTGLEQNPLLERGGEGRNETRAEAADSAAAEAFAVAAEPAERDPARDRLLDAAEYAREAMPSPQESRNAPDYDNQSGGRRPGPTAAARRRPMPGPGAVPAGAAISPATIMDWKQTLTRDICLREHLGHNSISTSRTRWSG